MVDVDVWLYRQARTFGRSALGGGASGQKALVGSKAPKPANVLRDDRGHPEPSSLDGKEATE
jgi:hypothetical protein